MTEAAREQAIGEHFPLLRKLARRVQRMLPGSDFDDLIGEGALGLIRAVDTFDPHRGPTLEFYASRVIVGAMLNGVRKLDPVSERVRREIREAGRERFFLATHFGTLPSQAQMEQRRPALKRAVLHVYRYTPLSLDSPLPQGERLSEDWDADPALAACHKGDRDGMLAAIDHLPPRQRDVVRLHYYGGRSLHQIGRAMSISPQRASQLHLAALKKLRKALCVYAAG